MECWADCLGDCAGGQSREHYISDGIFDGESVTAFGLSWCKDRPISIGLGSATSRILCKKHNESLSDVDAEAAKLSRFISSNIAVQPLSRDSMVLSGQALEKWSLKTLLSLGYIGALDPTSFTRLKPSVEIVNPLFRGVPVPEGAGLYFVTSSLSSDDFKVGLAWKAIRNQSNGKVFGMAFTFNGLRFVVSMLPNRGEKQINAMGVVDGFDYSAATVIYRPANVILGSVTTGRKVIDLQW